jgi:hypothetical protein
MTGDTAWFINLVAGWWQAGGLSDDEKTINAPVHSLGLNCT